MSKKSNLINKIICCVQEGYSIHRKIFSPNCVKKFMKNPTKFKIEKFLSRAIIWLNLIKISLINMFSHIIMNVWWISVQKKENFSFSFWANISLFFWIFVLSHIWLPRYEKTADFLAQMLFGSCIGSHWFQKLKNIQSDTQYLCKIPDIFSVSQPKCLL